MARARAWARGEGARARVGSSVDVRRAGVEMARGGDDVTLVGSVARVVVAFCAGASVAVGVMSTLEARRRRTEEAEKARLGERRRRRGRGRGARGVGVDVFFGRDGDVVRSHG